jgi:hypothetical protein
VIKEEEVFRCLAAVAIGQLPGAHLDGGAVSIAQITIEEEA